MCSQTDPDRACNRHAGPAPPAAPPAARPLALPPAAARPPRDRARRAGRRPLGGRGLARGSGQAPAGVGPCWCAGTSQAPRCCWSPAGPGRRSATPRSCAIGSTGGGRRWPPRSATAPWVAARGWSSTTWRWLPGCAAGGRGWWWRGRRGRRPSCTPVAALWANRKGVELANLTAEPLGEVIAAAAHGSQRPSVAASGSGPPRGCPPRSRGRGGRSLW
jgi:hypothetical protein